MENASEALIMAFSVMVFVMALSVAISSFGQAKTTADILLYEADETNYYDTISAEGIEKNRIVGLDTIIPTLYKYYKEDFTVIFKQANTYYKNNNQFSSDWTYMPIYETRARKTTGIGYFKITNYTRYRNWMRAKYYVNDTSMPNYQLWNFKDIFAFDLDDETLRSEPWVGSDTRMKTNIDAFLTGGKFHNPAYPASNTTYDYQYNNFIASNKSFKFVESTYLSDPIKVTTDDTSVTGAVLSQYSGLSGSSTTKEKKKRILVFTKVNSVVN